MRHTLPPNRRPSSEQMPETSALTDDDRRQALAEVLASETLRRSDQLRAILQFLCDAAIEGRGSQVSESVIAIDVLNRNPSYNPADDSSVRSRVYALRQKLTHYYEIENPSAPIRIEIPKGGYIPQFLLQSTQSLRMGSVRKSWRLWLTVALVVVAILIFVFRFQPSRSQVLNVWGPLIDDDGKPVLVSMGEAKVLQPIIQSDPPESATPSSQDSNGESRVGTGAARALFRLGGLFDRFHVSSQLRLSSTTSLEDLHHSPTVLLGAFNNQLTLDATRNLRYHFSQSGSAREISDSKEPSSQWRRHQDKQRNFTDDYGIAVRLMGQQSQEAVMIAAGLEQCGTAASMELLTDDLPQLTQSMPAGWKGKNFEVLVGVHMVDDRCGAPEIIRIEVW